MQKTLGLILLLLIQGGLLFFQRSEKTFELFSTPQKSYWFILHRQSNEEFLCFGEPGNRRGSALVKKFQVKVGIPGQRPTPLPQLLNKEYWVITDKQEIIDNPETAPYFLTLNVPVTENPPFGPEPYLECNGQCNWELPGAFGLHGINGDLERIADSNPGSSGCIRHKDGDITYLYNLLDLEKGEVRYYVEDV